MSSVMYLDKFLESAVNLRDYSFLVSVPALHTLSLHIAPSHTMILEELIHWVKTSAKTVFKRLSVETDTLPLLDVGNEQEDWRKVSNLHHNQHQ